MNDAPVIIVQARMRATRLPGKVLMPLLGQPMLLWQLDRLSQVQIPGSSIVIAIPPGKDNEPILRLCEEHGYDCVVPQCPESDVLARYYIAAEMREAKHVIRVTGDCPLIDPMVIGALWAGYLANTPGGYLGLAPSWPDGQDCECVGMETLSIAAHEATTPSDREHVTPFIWRQPERFTCRALACQFDLHEQRYSVDTPEGLAFTEAILRTCLLLYGPMFGWREIAYIIQRFPKLQSMQEKIPLRNQAYVDQIYRERGGTTVHTWDEIRHGKQR